MIRFRGCLCALLCSSRRVNGSKSAVRASKSVPRESESGPRGSREASRGPPRRRYDSDPVWGPHRTSSGRLVDLENQGIFVRRPSSFAISAFSARRLRDPIWDPQKSSRMAQEALQRAPRSLQGFPQTPPRAPHSCQRGSQERSKMLPSGPQAAESAPRAL